MKNINKKDALKIILTAAKQYNEKLLNRDFLICYKEEKEIRFSCIRFKKHNFLHLTGVRATDPPNVFYSKCINRKLSERDFEIDAKGKVSQKMAVLPYLGDLLYNSCMIGPFLDQGIMIRADYFVGNNRAYISLGFRYSKTKDDFDYPVSLYNEDIRKVTHPTCQVLAIFSKLCKENIFDTYTFCSKNVDLEKLEVPSEYKISV